jgi:cell division protein FtsB
MRRAVRLLLLAVTLAGIVFLFVLPARIWLAQDRAASVAERQHSVLSKENAALTKQVAQLQSNAYIEQVAREEYGLVMPGEHAYDILPPATPPTTAVPAKRTRSHDHSFWRDLEFWR